jgi:MoxR-like ATPase
MNIIGWDRIIPQLAVFFATIDRRPGGLSPFNLFLSGEPGSNKSEGALAIAELCQLTVQLVDCSTLDDVSELAGVVDLHANRERGEAKLIEGDLLKAQILVLDEFLNTRKHVVPQFRLMLQGKLVLLGKNVPVKIKAIVAAGNLSEDMKEGEAHVLDSPTADRFAMLVRVPALSELSVEHAAAIIEGRVDSPFAPAFLGAVQGIKSNFNQVASKWSPHVTLYVQTLLANLKDTSSEFGGRRAKLLRLFVIAALALCEAESQRDRNETIWQVVHDSLSYHHLSGLEVNSVRMRQAHDLAMSVFSQTGDALTEARIAAEPLLANKVALVLKHTASVSAITKAHVFGQVVASSDRELQFACRIVAGSPAFINEPADIGELIRRGYLPPAEFWQGLEGWNTEEAAKWRNIGPEARMAWWAQWMTGTYEGDTGRLLAAARKHLRSWDLDPVGKY